jgi:hypothetical protein
MTVMASNALAWSSGNFQRVEAISVLNAEEFKAALQKV